MSDGSAKDEALLQAGLDALALPVCILNPAGVVRLTAGSWGARAPGGPYELAGSLNLLRALEHRAAAGDMHARLIHDGLASILAGRARHFRLEYPTGAEGKKWQLLQVVPMPGGGAVLSHSDVTARRTAESRVRRLSRRYSAVGAAGAVAFWELDLRTQVVLVDVVLCRLLGYPVAQPQSWSEWRARIHMDDVALVDALWRTVCAPGTSTDTLEERAIGPMEVRLADTQGAYRCFECSGRVVPDRQAQPVRAQGTLHDVTDRRAAQDALQRSNAHLQELARRLVAQE